MALYNAGVLTTGTNTIPVTNIHTQIAATNTVEGTQTTDNAASMATTTITDPDGTPDTGDETATPGTLSVTYNDQTWTAGASGTIDFREKTVIDPPCRSAGARHLVSGINFTAIVAGIITSGSAVTPVRWSRLRPRARSCYTDPAAAFASTKIVPTASGGRRSARK